ncbi:MAG: hypothetical protein R6W99_08575 [Clostridia bacterium]
MGKGGYASAEAAVVLPLFIILITVLLIVFARVISRDTTEKPGVADYIRTIHSIDSIKRKAVIMNGLLE